MTWTTFILCSVLAFFGLNSALVAWYILEKSSGRPAALLAFYTILLATCWFLIQTVNGSVAEF